MFRFRSASSLSLAPVLVALPGWLITLKKTWCEWACVVVYTRHGCCVDFYTNTGKRIIEMLHTFTWSTDAEHDLSNACLVVHLADPCHAGFTKTHFRCCDCRGSCWLVYVVLIIVIAMLIELIHHYFLFQSLWNSWSVPYLMMDDSTIIQGLQIWACLNIHCYLLLYSQIEIIGNLVFWGFYFQVL